MRHCRRSANRRASVGFGALGLLMLAGCASAPRSAAVFGSVAVSNTTNGEPYEQRLYTLSIGRSTRVFRRGGAVVFDSLPPGTHAVRLRHLDVNCSIAALPGSVTVLAGARTDVEFVVDCVPAVGVVRVENQTGGPIVSVRTRDCGTREWGRDLLPSVGDAGTIRPTEARTFEIRWGCVDLRVQRLETLDPGPLVASDTLGIRLAVGDSAEWIVR